MYRIIFNEMHAKESKEVLTKDLQKQGFFDYAWLGLDLIRV
jgi:hypothetical protein